jgi:DNA-3-methyladenine glycosylase
MKLNLDFYTQADVVSLAKQLIGKVLVTKLDGVLTSGIICETEAYNGIVDKASHAYGNRRTKRTETMYARGGVAYIYLCYGIHHLFNVVTNVANVPHAVLIRGIQPLDGIDAILKRKNLATLPPNLGIGPGKVSSCLGLHTGLNNTQLTGHKIWIEDRGIKVPKTHIVTGPRVGVDYAGEDAALPYRFQYFAQLVPNT